MYIFVESLSYRLRVVCILLPIIVLVFFIFHLPVSNSAASNFIEKRSSQGDYSNPIFHIKFLDIPAAWEGTETYSLDDDTLFIYLTKSSSYKELSISGFAAMILSVIKSENFSNLNRPESFPQEVLRTYNSDCNAQNSNYTSIDNRKFLVLDLHCDDFDYKIYYILWSNLRFTLAYSAPVSIFHIYVADFDKFAHSLIIK